MTTPYDLLAKIASSYEGTTEATNKPMIDAFRQTTGVSAEGQNYCMDFVQFCLKKMNAIYSYTSNLLISQGVMEVWNSAKPYQKSQYPNVGLIVVWQKIDSWEGHCGIVISPGGAQFNTVEGNTSPDPLSGATIDRLGIGVYSKTRNMSAKNNQLPGALKLLGFLNPYC